MNENNCYKCQHRGNVPGDTHSCCNHPLAGHDNLELMVKFAVYFGAFGLPFKITADAHGIRQGWFYWPVNFDPIWLIICEGFTKKEIKE